MRAPSSPSNRRAERVALRERRMFAKVVKDINDARKTTLKKPKTARKQKSERVSPLTRRMKKVKLTK
ncbi:hypothetical protein M422DRAFT_30843, partial [Sphaerobolus stellatus SS14]